MFELMMNGCIMLKGVDEISNVPSNLPIVVHFFVLKDDHLTDENAINGMLGI